MDKIVVGIAEGKIAHRGQSLISYALGSCVGVCLYDLGRGIAGMAHIVLPRCCDFPGQTNVYKFADTGIEKLLSEMTASGARRSEIRAKMAGGARMFRASGPDWEIGERNVEMAKKTLISRHIPIIAEDTGSNYGRTLMLYADDARLEIRTVRRLTKVI